MSSHSRMLSLLDLFSIAEPVWSADALTQSLGYSRPTLYRYLRELVEAGLLQRVEVNRYALGARVIALDYIVRHADPLLIAAIPVLHRLASQTGCDAMMSCMIGDNVIDIHHERYGSEPVHSVDPRGRIRDRFKSGPPKVIFANLPKARQRSIYFAYAAEAETAGIGKDWDEVRAYMQAIRKRGYYVSRGEMAPGLSSVTVPVFAPDKALIATILIVARNERFCELEPGFLVTLLRQAAAEISRLLARSDSVTP